MKLILFLLLFISFFSDSFSQEVNDILEQVNLIEVVTDSTVALSQVNEKMNSVSPTCNPIEKHPYRKKIKDALFTPLNEMYMVLFKNKHTLTDKMLKDTIGNPIDLEEGTINKISNFNTEFFYRKNLKQNDPSMMIKEGVDIFSNGEIIDLELYALTSIGILPSHKLGWKKLISHLENYQGFILLGAAGGIIGTDNLSIPLRGKIFNVREGKVSGGYYANLSSLGLHFKPKLSAGVALNSKYGVSMRAGFTNRLNAVGDEKELDFESSLVYQRPHHQGQNLNFSTNISYNQSFFNNNPYDTKEKIVSTGISANYQLNRYNLSAGLNLNHRNNGDNTVSTSVVVRKENSPFSFSLRASHLENTRTSTRSPYVAFIFTQDLSWGQLHKKLHKYISGK